jgi:hypothetical protein
MLSFLLLSESRVKSFKDFSPENKIPGALRRGLDVLGIQAPFLPKIWRRVAEKMHLLC